MRICMTCKNENDDESRFCERCGAGLEEVASAPAADIAVAVDRTCPSCSHPARASNRFCTNCGLKLASSTAEAPGPICAGCGNAQAGTDAYCGWCGFRASTESAPAREVAGDELRLAEGPFLTVLAGREKDKVYSLGSSGMRLGRARENDICLDTDGYVSSHHARVYQQGTDFFVEDAGSVNGTFVKVRRASRLESGDELKIGQSLFRFEGRK